MEKSFKKPRVPDMPSIADNVNPFIKWAPLICAGSAIGLSIFVLREMKKTRHEIFLLKSEQGVKENPMMYEKMENLERQLKTITEYIKNNKNKVVKNVVIDPVPTEINIINDDEYEEVEVTDDEAED